MPGGESGAEIARRVVDVLDDLADRHRGETLLVVAHGGAILATLSVVAWRAGRSDDIANCAFAVLERDGDGWRLATDLPASEVRQPLSALLLSPRAEDQGQGEAAEVEVLHLQGPLQAVSDPDAEGRHPARGYTVKKRKLVKVKSRSRSSRSPPDRPAPVLQESPVPAVRFVEQLNAQIGNEFAAHNQYLACAVYYDALTMPQMAAFFYGQALEEREHALMMVQYLLDTDAEVTIPGVEAPVSSFDDVVAPSSSRWRRSAGSPSRSTGCCKTAREESDFASEQFMQWFIKEQVEEVATMSDLLAVVTRNRDDIEDIEEYVAREQSAGSDDPTAPRIAGA